MITKKSLSSISSRAENTELLDIPSLSIHTQVFLAAPVFPQNLSKSLLAG